MMNYPCGKYLVAALPQWIASLEAHGELELDQKGWSKDVKTELLSISAATVDRYLKAERDRLRLKGVSTTKAGRTA